MTKARGWWVCGELHVFQAGESSGDQGYKPEEIIPQYCSGSDDETDWCGHSAHLFGPYSTKQEAIDDIPDIRKYLK